MSDAGGSGGAGEIVSLAHDGALAVVTFDAPPLNLYTRELADGLAAVVSELERTPPRGVLFRAAGRVVSGGVDVSLFAALDGSTPATAVFAELIELNGRVERLPCPTVFAAHALCLTWAFELALACDVIIAAESATFGLVERVIGLTPAAGGLQRLAERAGTGRAKELVMEGRPFTSAALERWNVVTKRFEDDGFDEAARAYATDLAEGPTRAHAATKAILRAYLRDGVEGADAATPAIAGALFDTEDLRGAVRSFLDDGPGRARFSGR